MSTNSLNLTEWTKSKLSELYEPSSETESLQSQFDTTFSQNAQVLMNHESISLGEFQKRISQLLGMSTASLEWKDILESGLEDAGEGKKVGIVAGFLVLKRVMPFRIRAAPAHNNTFIAFSAKIEEDQSVTPDEGGDKRRIVHLVQTSVTKAAPVHLQGLPQDESSK